MEGLKEKSSRPKESTQSRKSSRSLSYYAWMRLRRNKLAMFGFSVIGLATLVAFLGANIRPDSSPDANDQKLQLPKKKPGFAVTMLKVKKNQVVEKTWFWEMFLFGGAESQYKTIPIFDYKISGSEIIVEEYTGSNERYPGKRIPMKLADVVFSLDPTQKYTENQGQGTVSFTDVNGEQKEENLDALRKEVASKHIFEKRFWLGTDQFGRDLLSRLMAGTLVSLSVGFISVLISLVIGILLGSLSGYFRGWVDDLIMWVINVVWSIPTVLLVIAITFALGKGFWQIFMAVGLTMWVEVARVIRGQIISLREQEFIEAGRALGFTNFRLIVRHILPNVMGPVMVISAANFAAAILIEAGLSFLGIGLQPPMPSWGRMIKEHYGYIMVDGAYLAILPGLAIMVTVLAFMLVGNGLRDALDTKSMGDGSMSMG